MIPERYQIFRSEISGKFPIGNFGKFPRPIPKCNGFKVHFGVLSRHRGPHLAMHHHVGVYRHGGH